MLNNKIEIRTIEKKDLEKVHFLMQKLAEFEGYSDKFCVTVDSISEAVFEQQKLEILVACINEEVEGICVFYTLPFTYDLKPWFYLKELFVSNKHRSLGLGNALMSELITTSKRRGVSKIRWEVLKTNLSAIEFYQCFGSQSEAEWSLYSLTP